MNFTFTVAYKEEGKDCKDIIERELEDVQGEYNQVPWGDTYVDENWYPYENAHNYAIFEQAIEDITKEYIEDDFTDVVVKIG